MMRMKVESDGRIENGTNIRRYNKFIRTKKKGRGSHRDKENNAGKRDANKDGHREI